MNNIMPSVTFALGLSLLGLGAGFYPQTIPVAAVSTGASLMAVSVHKRKKDSEVVAKSFSQMYEQNQGLVNPERISIDADVSVSKVNGFLEQLAAETNGQKITVPTNDGPVVLYSFPHPRGALDQLTQNAMAWAEDQKKPLLQELAQVKQQLAFASMLKPEQLTPEQRTVFKEQNSPPNDPWNRLI